MPLSRFDLQNQATMLRIAEAVEKIAARGEAKADQETDMAYATLGHRVSTLETLFESVARVRERLDQLDKYPEYRIVHDWMEETARGLLNLQAKQEADQRRISELAQDMQNAEDALHELQRTYYERLDGLSDLRERINNLATPLREPELLKEVVRDLIDRLLVKKEAKEDDSGGV